jgi:flagellar motor switch protein FliG
MVESEDAKLALTIRNNMFTFEDLLGLPETGIRELLTAVDKKSLATSLKGAAEDLKNHIFKTMSSRAVEMLKEDMEAMGPVRSQAVVQAQQEVVAAARQLEAQGKLVLNNEAEEAFVV